MMKEFIRSAIIVSIVLMVTCTGNQSVRLIYAPDEPQLKYAARKIEAALELKSDEVWNKGNLVIEFKLEEECFEPEAFSVIKSGNCRFEIIASDLNGLMYGGLEVAEQISLYDQVNEVSKTPFVQKRGIKMNIPLDARTPSYDDTGDAAQKNIIEMWSWDFWEEYLDNLAMHRFNILTLWNPHPFPSMIKMADYPDVALNDVCVTTLKPTGKESEWAEPQATWWKIFKWLRK
jgi:hypothetical protein